jgi:hypothetical protein
MKKNTHFILFILISALFATGCSPSASTKQSGSKRFFVQPVNLSIHGIERDTSIRKIFEEAFSKYKIQVITDEEMKIKNENEAKRVGQIVFTKDSKFDNAEDIIRAMGREHKYVSNRLSVNLELRDKDDSLMIYKVWWSNAPFPPDFSHVYVTKQKEINLINLSYSIRENIYSIVDSILYSKELK